MKCKKCNNDHDGTFGSGVYCSIGCANSRSMTNDIKQKISSSLIAGLESGNIIPTSRKGMTISKPRTEEHNKNFSESIKKTWDKKGRVSEEHKRARNKANVYAYRARLRNAIPEDADLKLITKIYEHCPEGYHVDHKIALANGGLHHQDNLQYLPISENCRKGKDRKYDESLVIHWKI